ncbi:phage major tail tube protein, partial [Salmonella enterica]
QNENPEFSSAFGCTYIKQVVDGETLLELDYLANIFRVNDADQLNAYRNNIGG